MDNEQWTIKKTENHFVYLYSSPSGDKIGVVAFYMRIYLDTCCFNRPYDLQNQASIVMEGEAILTIIGKCSENNNWFFFGSDVLEDEMDNIIDPIKKQKVLGLYSSTEEHIELNNDIIKRALNLQSFGFGSYDALHLASAENAGADVFLTTDKKLINQAKKVGLSVDVSNPFVWLSEVGL